MAYPNRLRGEADLLEAGWQPIRAIWRHDGVAEEIALHGEHPQFRPMTAIPYEGRPENQTYEYEVDLDLPDNIHGVSIEGQPLEMYVIGLSATSVWVDDRLVLDEEIPLIAAGPAKFTVLPSVHVGRNGALRIVVRTGRGEVHGRMVQAFVWFHLGTAALTDAFRAVDTAAAQLELADALARDDSERGLIAEVTAEIDALPGALHTRRDEVTALIGRLATILARAEEYEIMCIGHSHIDLSWLWDWRDARGVQRRDLATIADLMDDYPEFRFTHSQAAAYRAVQEDDPVTFARVRALVQAGRLEPATMQWVESDTNIASGPATARQILEGVTWAVDELGVRPHVHLAPDTFGHAGNLPQLTSSAGGDVYYHHRANPGGSHGGRLWPAYWWEGDDGTRVLGISTPIYLGPLTAGRIVRDLVQFGVELGRRTICYFYGVGDHGGGPTRDDLDFRRILDDTALFPRVTCRTVGEYRDAVLASGEALPVHRGESMTVFEGCYISHSDGKQANRTGENLLVAADALLALTGEREPAEIAEAWRTVLLNQFHDIGGGSAIRVVYGDVRAQLDAIEDAAGRVIHRALDTLESGHRGSWLVTNLTPEFVVTPVLLPTAPGGVSLVDEAGRVSAVQETFDGRTVAVLTLAPFETKGLAWSDIPAETDVFVVTRTGTPVFYEGHESITLESASKLVQVRADSGVITTYLDKRTGKEFLEFGEGRDRLAVQTRPDLGFGVLQVLDEHPHLMTAWLADEFYREESVLRGAVTDIVENGPVRTVLRTTHRIRNSTVIVHTEMYGGIDAVFTDLDIDWRELGDDDRGLATLAIVYTARLDGARARYETPYSVTERPADGRVVPALRWAHVGNADAGFAVCNTGRYGHEALGPRMRLHLARGSYDPDALGDLGRHHVRLALIPHTGDWRGVPLIATAAALNTPPVVRVVSPPESAKERLALWRPLLHGDRGIRLAELKPGRAGGVVARIADLYGDGGRAELPLPPGWGAMEVTVAEDAVRPLEVRDGRLTLSFGAHEVRTIRIAEQRHLTR
ncbi:MAG: glycoside hydrolase family 38 C-terminal domain-containing protein [Microbacteriaceae bacterium]